MEEIWEKVIKGMLFFRKMAVLMTYSFILILVNSLLILSLLYVYIKNSMKIRSLFTTGLTIFALLFLIQNAVSIYFYLTMVPYYVDGVELYIFIYSALQTFAFAILNIITWR